MTPKQQLDTLSRRERLHFVRACCLFLGLTLCLLALVSLGSRVDLVDSPSAWAPTGSFSRIAVHLLPGSASYALALFISGAVLLIAALALTIYARYKRGPFNGAGDRRAKGDL